MPCTHGRVRAAAELSEREQRILREAAAAFGEKGFHGVGMDELGSRAGLSGPSLYRHFSGKDEILATVLHLAMDELDAATAPVHPDPRADLDRALRHHVRFALQQRTLVRLHQREAGNLVEPWASAFTRRLSAYTRDWEHLVATALTGRGADEVAALTQAALGTVFSASTWPARALRVGDVDVVCDLVVGLLRDGLSGS